MRFLPHDPNHIYVGTDGVSEKKIILFSLNLWFVLEKTKQYSNKWAETLSGHNS